MQKLWKEYSWAHKYKKNEKFEKLLNSLEKEACKLFKNVTQQF